MNEAMQQPVTAVKGIGEETAAALADIGIATVGDLLAYAPYRYDDYEQKDLAAVRHEEKVTLEGKVYSAPLLTYYGKKKSRLSFRMLADRYLITVVCFNRPYLKEKIALNETVTVIGKWDRHRQTINAYELRFGPAPETTGIEPVYSVRSPLTVKTMRRLMKAAFEQFGEHIPDLLPPALRRAYRLVDKQEALRALHFPRTREELHQARRRLIYEEFLLYQLKMQALRRLMRDERRGVVHSFSEERLSSFLSGLPFVLTNAQRRVIGEILADMRSPRQMNRLLQGDVGSGKTVVAAVALYAAALSGFQGALMVPTEILAEQHARSLTELFADTDVTIALLTSSVKGKQRKAVLSELEEGTIDIVVGTHALIQEGVQFRRLGLVITDEQHRFGVEQRRVLREKGHAPDVLMMTATPIPRTLAITAFGDMDVSVLDEMPAGRKKVETYWVKHHQFSRVLDFIEKELRRGHQAYVICPLIEESDKLDVQNAIDVHSQLVHYYRGNYEIGLMHGRLSADEKERVMRAFSENRIHVLVSTTVVEVGVNVPNATVMVIYDAERFGLAQLHQLRGRVGRGDAQSYCILIADPKSEVGKERMRIMTETADGFVLAEKDLELRGPGDVFGTKQSGLPEFRYGDPVHDYRILEVARRDAAKLVSSTAFWRDEAYAGLRAELEASGILDGEKLD
ncbi:MULTISPECIES: ATP-dependent DNA helicase RecG [Geobacillus]|uniref:ATP-dependent DNA helicase RecG n=1 Tax=Geobacillus thermocatenulatus TaxID=33938 RepID=A0A226Q461_9BACL|nr:MULTISPECIES: ATP-dependent DNA helicase RecG [Geobacillus]ASS99977.1 ATP-dependent DNA helicase RecG [Geobacillus thermocatenulatus]KLR72618.1 ATP-dependent DNA helicase [Geobacillus sp. T6]OXB86359.1 DNA helicase RecG [Geobacillus thermocatenulatus]RAN23490.1 ATP-dependent DNA helicase [Geobacillus sp. A8]